MKNFPREMLIQHVRPKGNAGSNIEDSHYIAEIPRVIDQFHFALTQMAVLVLSLD
ncbi:MAG: hypothetical protein K1X28_03205 [Parachlamydiales bacterium]|nr:hypothetical protein [Parachlamydiales bacterium]